MAKKIIKPTTKKPANKTAVKKFDFNSPEFKRESEKMSRKPKAAGTAEFDPTGMLFGAGAAGLKILTGAGFGAGAVGRKSFLQKGPSKPGGIDVPSIKEYEVKTRTGQGAKTPKKLGKPTRKPVAKKK